jgi:hypothetical protein
MFNHLWSTVQGFHDPVCVHFGLPPEFPHLDGYQCRYQKVYKSLGEIKHRFATFLENLELIEATNKKKLSYTLGINGVN